MSTFGCGATDDRLIDLLDGRLEPAVAMRLHAHLEGCPTCRVQAEIWREALPRMRAAVPEAPSDLAAQRMQVEVLRQLQLQTGEATARTPGGGAKLGKLGRPARFGMTGLWIGAVAAAAAAMAVAGGAALRDRQRGLARSPSLAASIPSASIRPSTSPDPAAEAPLATVTRAWSGRGAWGRGGGGLPDTIFAGVPLEIPVGGEAELAMDRGSRLHVSGPARLSFAGTPHRVAVQLAAGRLHAEIVHRQVDETFAVVTPDARVEVRGTTFDVRTGTGQPGSWIRVEEGQVAVRFASGASRLVGAGQVASSPTVGGEGAEPTATAAATTTTTCRAQLRSCLASAQKVRECMRAGAQDRALSLIATASRRAFVDRVGDCGEATAACEDELRYLRAEALRSAGRIDEAVSAYTAIDRPGAPPAMRQNAAYAAAELERRRGHLAEAHAEYERALVAASAGALHEEALVGAMETAAALGKASRAQTLARSYRTQFPGGRFDSVARRWAESAARPEPPDGAPAAIRPPSSR